jgi:hypothetical protein
MRLNTRACPYPVDIDSSKLPKGAVYLLAGEPDAARRLRMAKALERVLVPDVLAKPLRFGDVEQTKALRSYERELSLLVDADPKSGKFATGKWEVTFERTQTATVKVEAGDEEEARELAEEEVLDADWDSDGWDSITEVRRLTAET